MTLNEYIKKLKKLVSDMPTAGKLEVWYSKDDEGNDFKPIYYDPAVCHDPDEFIDDYDSDAKIVIIN